MSNVDDPFGSYGLARMHLEHKSLFDLFFGACRTRLSDYTFANTYIWRDSIHLRWRILHDNLCVFANGDGGLTMLFPPMGGGDFDASLRDSLEICAAYNRANSYKHPTRIEYVSDEFISRFGPAFGSVPMSGDYVYLTRRLIDLGGGDLASKRQARNRFARRYQARVEDFNAGHADACLKLLGAWKEQSIENGCNVNSVCIKRAKEVAATADAMANFRELGLTGMVLYANDELVGFTFGEMLSADTCSILIEKCDRNYVGAAQYIFSEFCRRHWRDTTFCNVGDDWEIASLAWTKQSYRPVQRLNKHVVRPAAAPAGATATLPAQIISAK